MQLWLLIILVTSAVGRIPYQSEALCEQAAAKINERSVPVYAVCIPAEPIALRPDRLETL
jgi:hypothetical protein